MKQTPVAQVPYPQLTSHTAARMLRGHRMGALKDGWLLLYEALDRPADDRAIDELCIVQTADHRILARVVKRGRRPNCWDLLTVTGEQELDVPVTWAEPVTLILPYKPSADEALRMLPVA